MLKDRAPRKIKVCMGSHEEKLFMKSRSDDHKGLSNDGKIDVVMEENIPSDARVFGSDFIGELKGGVLR